VAFCFTTIVLRLECPNQMMLPITASAIRTRSS
jgi:hypothetical protein